MLPQWRHILILDDDTDIFVHLVVLVWHYRSDAQPSIRKYTGKLIAVNATASQLGNKYRESNCYQCYCVTARQQIQRKYLLSMLLRHS